MTTITNILNGLFGYNQDSPSPDTLPDQQVTRKGSQILLNRSNSKPVQVISNIPNKIPPVQNDEPSFFDRMVMEFGAFGVKTVLALNSTKKRDINVVRSIVADSDDIFDFINRERPRLEQLIAKQIPALDEFIKGHGETADQVMEELILHVLGNLVLEIIPKDLKMIAINGGRLPDAYQLEPEALAEKCLLRLIDVIGPHLDKADATVKSTADITGALFTPLADDLFDLLLPPDDAFRALIPAFVLPIITKFISDQFLDKYAPFKHWILGEDMEALPDEPSLIQEELNYYIPMILEKVTDYSIRQDLAFFQNLTGQDDVQEIVEKFSGPLLELMDLPVDKLDAYGLSDPNLVKKASEAAILRALSNACSVIFENKLEKDRQVSTDVALRKIVKYFTKKLRKDFKEAGYHENTLEQFYPASVSCVGLFLPQFAWLDSLMERNQEKLLKPLAEAHFSFYNATIKDTSEEEYKARLRDVLWEYHEVVRSGKFGSSRVPLSNPTKDQSVLAGIEPAVEQLYLLCDSSTKIIRSMGADYIGDMPQTLKFLQGLQKTLDPENQLSDEVLTTITSAINKILTGGDPEIQIFGDRCQHVIKSMVFKGLVRWLEKVPAALRSPPEELLFKALTLPLSIGVEGLDVDDLDPTVNAWIDLVFDADEDLPIPDSLKDMAEKVIRDKASSLVSKIYAAVTSWIVDRNNAEAELNDLFPSKNPLKMCRLIPHLAVEGIPYGIRENQDKITEQIMKHIASLLPPNSDLSVLEKIVSGFVNQLGDNNSDDFKKLLEFVGIFSETAAIRFIGNVFGRIHQMENDGVNLTSVLEDLLQGTLGIANEHMKGINVAKEDADKTILNRDELIQSFEAQGILHSALRDDASKDEFFKKVTLTIFEIFKIKKDTDFPVPDYAKESVYDLLTQVTPPILNDACDLIRDASTINRILVSALNQGSQEDDISILDRLFSQEHKDFKEHLKDLDSKFSDQFQSDLQEALGETVQALVGLQTDRIPKYLVKNEGLRRYAAEAISQPIRAELRNKKTGNPISLLTMLDGAFGKVSDSLAPAAWDEDNLVYFETSFKGKVQIDDQTGEPKQSAVPNLARFFPKTQKEKALKVKYDTYQDKKTKKNVPRYLRKLISDQTSQIAIEAFILFWAHLEKEFSQWLVTHIGEEYGEKVYNVLLPITRWVIKYPLSIGMIIFNYSVWLIASQVLKWVLSKEAEEIVEDVNTNIHDNAIYKGLELILDRYADELASIDNDDLSDESNVDDSAYNLDDLDDD